MKTLRLTANLLLLTLLVLSANPARAQPAAGRKIYLPLVLAPSPQPDSTFQNPGFELGTLNWTISSNGGDGIVSEANAHNGYRSALLGDGRNQRIASIAQTVRISTYRPILVYWQYVESQELCPYDSGVEFDYLTVYVNGVEVQHYDICMNLQQETWEQWSLDLSAYAGRSITIKIEFCSDDVLPSQIFLDDFSFAS